MVDKVKKLPEVVDIIKDGSSLLVPGFYYSGRPETILKEIYNRGIKNLDVLVNDTAFPDDGVGQLVMNGQVVRLTLTFIGVNPEINNKIADLVNAGKLEVNVIPQGTLIERIRAGGFGLGGVLTPTGIGTVVAEGKDIIEVDGKEYLFEKPITGDFSLVRAYKADKYGNLIFRHAARNFNPYIAAAGKYTIAEAEIISDKPLNPDRIHTPGVFVDAVVKAKKHKIRKKK